MFFICEYERKHEVARALAEMGAGAQNFSFDKYGLQTWRYRP
jgi:D-glycero-alpha-D-manno-heptose-7-phosphate kinase